MKNKNITKIGKIKTLDKGETLRRSTKKELEGLAELAESEIKQWSEFLMQCLHKLKVGEYKIK